ncbi:MAG: dicarboxylate/amino acid:cation symporter [Tenericutes bacterium]|nr:dicarboxylate/amino acid:cation symporter [Mycoplasmatota bacterium]
MKKIVKNYMSSIVLLASLIIGGILGFIFKEKILILKPLGDLFINLLLVIIVPLIFLSITTSIGKMKKPQRLRNILLSIIMVFIVTSVISVVIGMISTRINLVGSIDSKNIVNNLDLSIEEETTQLNILEQTVKAVSVNNFYHLFNNENMIALIIFSIIIGISINLTKDKGNKFLELLESANFVVEKYLKIIMYYAPIGLGVYFGALIATFGNEIAVGYAKTFIIYIVASIIIYFGVYSLYAFIAAGKKGLIAYWKNILPPTITALATCSSAVSMPVNNKSVKEIGVSDDIADSTTSLGTSFHKDGSTLGSVFKIMFLVYLFNTDPNIFIVLGVALVATLLVSAVPIGGGTISELFIINMMGFPIAALPILTIIATIIDPPATVLNVTGDTASSMLISRIVDGKKWLKTKTK